MDEKLLDLTDSKFTLEGTPDEQKAWSSKFEELIDDLKQDLGERKGIYKKRHDFYSGNQGDYSNIVGVIKDTKQKKGHTNQVANYAGMTVIKKSFGLANNPPKISTVPSDATDDIETIKAQAVESYIDSVFDDKINKFWKKTYRRSCFIQGEYGDAAVKTFIQDGKIKIIGHDDMGSVMVAWNGNPGEYDSVIVEMQLTPKKIMEEYGIKVNEKLLPESDKKEDQPTGAWQNNGQWGTKGGSAPGKSELPSGKSKLSTIKVCEYDSDSVYAVKIGGELAQLVFKDDVTYPRIKFWTIVPNIPNPPSPWSIADHDHLMDVQIELNDNDNRSSDHLRVGSVQRYVAYNMQGFDFNSLKTSSGQIIEINDPDGKSRFEPLQTNINNFPDDQYQNRKMQQMYDLGLPKVNFGASGADSGRSKAIDYQSSIDITIFKRDSWELALQDICEKIQIFGNFLLGQKVDWFTNIEGEFIVRNVEFDWSDILPISASDKIVNIANKVNMIGISLKTALKELGYKNPDAEIAQLEKELANPNLMILRSKMWTLSQGILTAQMNASMLAQSNGSEVGGGEASPTLTSSQNSDSAKPMAAKGGTTSYSSSQGMVAKERQNMNAAGR